MCPACGETRLVDFDRALGRWSCSVCDRMWVPDVTHIGDLVPDAHNRRRHNPRNVGMIVDALHDVGAARSIVVDEHNTVLAGNGTVEAAAEAGITRVRVVEADGNELIAVRRRGLTPEQKRSLALYDNRAAELADWDVAQLAADLDAGLSLDQFFTAQETATLLAQLAEDPPAVNVDEVPSQRPSDVRVGDVFALGEHRLVCGDCTDPTVVEALLEDDRPLLLVSDAPYGVDYSGEWRDGVSGEFGGARLQMRGAVTNDDVANWEQAWRLFTGDVAYTWCASLRLPQAWAGVASAGFEVRSVIAWAKPSITISRGHYHHQFEPCLYAVRQGRTAMWSGGRTQSTVWEIAGMNPAGGSRETKVGHPTQKPVECMARPMRNHGRRGDFVFDPFVGSGTSIVAAEREHRRCLAVELEPMWVQVSIDRWEALTGGRASKLGEVRRG